MKRRETFLSPEYAGRGVLLLSTVVACASFGYFYSHGLSTLHYDAKAHLVVARRIVDSLFPGYSQMGAHWLPLIHLLYLPWVAMDAQYHSAFLPCLLSVIAFVLSVWLVFRISLRLTESTFAGLFAAAILLGNQNLLFLQSAPLTEPVFMVLFLSGLDGFLGWRAGGGKRIPWGPAVCTSLAALCRYEGWLLLGGILCLIACDWRMRVLPLIRAWKGIAVFSGVFGVPAAAHFGYIYFRLGDSFFQRVARGTAIPYETYKRPFLSALYHVGELSQAAGLVAFFLGLGGLFFFLHNRQQLWQRVPYLLLWIPSLANIPALYWGLIYRVRYSALLLPAVAVFGSYLIRSESYTRRMMLGCSLMVFALPWVSWVMPRTWEYHLVFPGSGVLWLPAIALVLLLAAMAAGKYRVALLSLAIAGMQWPVLSGEERPMLAEALEHSYLDGEQQEVIAYLGRNYDGTRILIDVGRLAPLMYDSRLPLTNFIYHDGDRTEWDKASIAPMEHVGWICAENGDEVWGMLHIDPQWAHGYALAVQTENYLLYRRNIMELKSPLPVGAIQ
jgi:hypothetical protein